MKRFVLYFILLVLAVWLGIVIHRDPGYVLITYQTWSLETTLWFAILTILILFLIFYVLFRISRGTTNLAEKWQIWSERRKEKKANKFTFQGLCQLAEGEWKQAEKSLMRGVTNTETPLINYLAAANAAQRQGYFEQRDNYLRLAHQYSPQAEIAIALTQAQLQVSAKQWELALASLRHLQQEVPHQTYVLKLLKTVYIALNDWQSLQELLPELKRYKVYDSSELEKLEQQIYFELLNNALINKKPEEVVEIWKTIPKQFQQDPNLLVIYAKYLLQQKEENRAEVLLREGLKKSWDSNLLYLYSEVQSDNLNKQIGYAEAWLKNHPNDANLLLCLGKLCAKNQEWDRARDYFSTSIQINPSSEALRELGYLYQQRNEITKAVDYYQQALFYQSTQGVKK